MGLFRIFRKRAPKKINNKIFEALKDLHKLNSEIAELIKSQKYSYAKFSRSKGGRHIYVFENAFYLFSKINYAMRPWFNSYKQFKSDWDAAKSIEELFELEDRSVDDEAVFLHIIGQLKKILEHI